jgi:hypothetical protein
LHGRKEGAKHQRHGIDEKEIMGGLGQTILLTRNSTNLTFYRIQRCRERLAGNAWGTANVVISAGRAVLSRNLCLKGTLRRAYRLAPEL